MYPALKNDELIKLHLPDYPDGHMLLLKTIPLIPPDRGDGFLGKKLVSYFLKPSPLIPTKNVKSFSLVFYLFQK